MSQRVPAHPQVRVENKHIRNHDLDKRVMQCSAIHIEAEQEGILTQDLCNPFWRFPISIVPPVTPIHAWARGPRQRGLGSVHKRMRSVQWELGG